MIATDVGEIDDVRLGHRVPVGGVGHANLEILEMLTEGMQGSLWAGGTRLMTPGDGRDRVGMTLDGRALQVMMQAAQAAHLFSATSTPRPTVNQLRHGASVSRALLGTRRIKNEDAPVVGCRLHHKLPRNGSITCSNTATKRPFSFVNKRDGVVQISIGKQRRHRAERLHIVHLFCRQRRRLGQETRRIEGPLFSVSALPGRRVDRIHEFGLLHEVRHSPLDLGTLVQTGQCAHPDAVHSRIPNAHPVQLHLQSVPHRFDSPFGHHGPANGRASLAALDGEFPAQFLHEQVEFGRSRLRTGTEHHAVQRVSLQIERHIFRQDSGMGLEHQARLR